LKIFIKYFSSITLSSLNYLETLHKKIGELLYQSTRVQKQQELSLLVELASESGENSSQVSNGRQNNSDK
jgi:hypothetical protein